MFDKYKTMGAYHYLWYQTGEPAWYKKAVDRCVTFCRGETLDIGCGDGVVASKIQDKGFYVLGIDNNQIALDLCPPEIPTANRDINQPMRGQWQYMVCLNVIEHLEHPEAVFRIFKDNITKAGIVITDMPQAKPSKYHVREFSPQELRDLFYPYETKPFKIDDNFHGIEVYH